MHRPGLFVRFAVGSKGTVSQERLCRKKQQVGTPGIDWVNGLSSSSASLAEYEMRPV